MWRQPLQRLPLWPTWREWASRWLLILLAAATFPVEAQRADGAAVRPVQAVVPPQARPSAAASLRARHAELLPQLRTSPFDAPLLIGSRESGDRIGGDVHAEVDHAFERVSAALATPTALCEMLLLHLNVHGCAPEAAGTSDVIVILIGPKRSTAVEPSYSMRYRLRTDSANAQYLRVSLQAERGPLSTSDYQIVFEAMPLDARRSFVRLEYAYSAGLVARLAMRTYLATAGRAKIGFTVVGRDAQGQPIYVRGERAALERNVLRYYLALLAVCATPPTQPASARVEAMLRLWFSLTERFAAQLHELDWDEYLLEKRADLSRPLPQLR